MTAASGTSPILNVYLQSSTNGGTTWYDFAHYSQITAAKTTVMQWSELNSTNANKIDTATGDGLLASGTVINGPIVNSALRVKWSITGTTPSFTFSVVAVESRL